MCEKGTTTTTPSLSSSAVTEYSTTTTTSTTTSSEILSTTTTVATTSDTTVTPTNATTPASTTTESPTTTVATTTVSETTTTTTTAAPTTTSTTAVPTTTTTPALTTTTTAAPTTTTTATLTTTVDLPDTIAEILSQQPTGTVSVTGVVYYVIATPELPSYYVYDGTGTILVYNDSHPVAVGDGVTFQATYDGTSPAPQLVNVTAFSSSTAFLTLPTYSPATVADLVAHPASEMAFYGATFALTGKVVTAMTPMGLAYYLEDLTTGAKVVINAKSFAPSGTNPFASLVESTVTVPVVVHVFMPMDVQWHVLTAAPEVLPPFVPGSGGSLNPPEPSDPVAGQFPGLYLTEVGRYLSFYFEGDPVWHPLAEMSFPSASSLGGTGYNLQYFDAGDSTWKLLDSIGLTYPLEASLDNLSLYLVQGYTLRLQMVGGPLGGQVSNPVTYELTAVPSEFTAYSYSWGMSESGTGVMMPFAGFEIYDVSVTAINWSSGSSVDVSSFVTIEWYRVDPVTFAMTKIPGATGASYVTTEADAGYFILFRAVGDGVNVGGYFQQMIQTRVCLMNEGYVTNATAQGFTLNLKKAVPGMSAGNFLIYDQDGIQVAIASVIASEDGASYAVTFQDSTVTTSYGLSYNGGSWAVAFPMGFGEMYHYMEYYQVTLTE